MRSVLIASVPYGMMPNGSPAAITASHIARPCVGRHVDLVGELAGVAHPEQPRRNRAVGRARVGIRRPRETETPRSRRRCRRAPRARRARFGPDSAAAAHCSVTDVDEDLELRPIDLQQVFEMLHHLDGVDRRRRHQVVRRRPSRDVVPSSITMPSSRSITP